MDHNERKEWNNASLFYRVRTQKSVTMMMKSNERKAVQPTTKTEKRFWERRGNFCSSTLVFVFNVSSLNRNSVDRE